MGTRYPCKLRKACSRASLKPASVTDCSEGLADLLSETSWELKVPLNPKPLNPYTPTPHEFAMGFQCSQSCDDRAWSAARLQRKVDTKSPA